MLTLKIRLDLKALDDLKADLRAAFPQVKSSHRVEAAARGCGVASHATLLAALKDKSAVNVVIDGGVFETYLCNHDFQVGAKPFWVAAGRVAMRQVHVTQPKLCWNGIGAGRIERGDDGTRPTPREHVAAFQDRQLDMLGPQAIEEFFRAIAFLGRVMPTKTIRRDAHSYRLKHIAEKMACAYPDGTELGPGYVSNGALIAAAIHMGFEHKTFLDDLGYLSLNAEFNMSKRSLDDLDCEIRPNGALAETRRRLAENRQYGWHFSGAGRAA